MLLTILLFCFSMFCLYVGANYLVDNSASLARKLGISALVVGLTFVAIGTSIPELFIGIVSEINHVPNLSLGNLLGASIAVLSLVLGIAACIAPIKIHISTLQNEIPFLILGIMLVFLLSMDGILGGLDGVLLLVFLIVYLANTFIVSKQNRYDDQRIVDIELTELLIIRGKKNRHYVFFILVGAIIVAVGAHFMVETALAFAHALHVPELLIGMTLVSIGTTLPELVTGIVSALKHHEDLELGTLLGSAMFNMLGILGIICLLSPIAVPRTVLFIDLPVLFAIAVILYPLMRRNFVIHRYEGVILIILYCVYVAQMVF
ncbi:MAG: calcium/sodium antiporter [archaeon]